MPAFGYLMTPGLDALWRCRPGSAVGAIRGTRVPVGDGDGIRGALGRAQFAPVIDSADLRNADNTPTFRLSFPALPAQPRSLSICTDPRPALARCSRVFVAYPRRSPSSNCLAASLFQPSRLW